MPSYRIEFQIIAFTKSDHLSPQRMEDEITLLIQNHKAFGYVKNISVTRTDTINHTTEDEENDED